MATEGEREVNIPQQLNDQPELKYINRHVKENICAAGSEVWLELGIELLQKDDIAALKIIKNNVSDCSVRCSDMFKLWLQRQPSPSWRHLLTALKHIRQNNLASTIEKLLSVEQVSEEIDQILRDDQLNFRQQMSQESYNESKEAEATEIMKPDDLFQLLLREKVIPKAAVCEWRDLGIELDLSGADLNLIEKNVQQTPVVIIATAMLEDWLKAKKYALVEDLITAIDRVDLKAYAATLNKEYDPKKKLTEKDLQKIIPNIATKWKDIGIELAVSNLDNYEKNPDLTEERFKQMLQLWLSVNPKPVDELCEIFYKGLQGIDLIAAAREFKDNYEKFKTNEALKN